jgi:hypothetical protein
MIIMAEKFYEFVCKHCGVEKITPENIELVRYCLDSVENWEIRKETNLSPHTISKLKTLLLSPTPPQQEILKALYELGKKRNKVPLRYLRFLLRVPFPISKYVSLALLELFDPPPAAREKWMLKIYPYLMEKYWHIDEFGKDVYERSRTRVKRPRARRGERIQQALEILGVSSIDELTEEDIPKIKRLSRVDFGLKGYYIPQYSLQSLRNSLIRQIRERGQKVNTYRR